MIKHITLALLFTCCIGSCKKEVESKDILIDKPKTEKKQDDKPLQSTDYSQEYDISWLGNDYKVIMKRQVDKSLPMVKDENGLTYYDNRITIAIQRRDGSYVMNKTFTKSDFQQYYRGNKSAEQGGLLGIVYDCIENDKVVFAGSIGSPERSSDMYLPVIIKVDRNGNYSIAIDNRMENIPESLPENNYEDDGV